MFDAQVMGKLSEEQFTSGSCFQPALEIVVTPSETKKGNNILFEGQIVKQKLANSHLHWLYFCFVIK